MAAVKQEQLVQHQQTKQPQAPQQAPTWVASSVRRNCDYCVKKKVKCAGNLNGNGCSMCLRKGIKCEYSIKKKPGPKCRKREEEEGMEEAMTISSSALALAGVQPRAASPGQLSDGVPAQVSSVENSPHTTYANGGVVRSGSIEGKAVHDCGVGEVGSGSASGMRPDQVLLPSSPSSRHLLTPSKKAKPTHDKGTRAACRKTEEDKQRKDVLVRQQQKQKQTKQQQQRKQEEGRGEEKEKQHQQQPPQAGIQWRWQLSEGSQSSAPASSEGPQWAAKGQHLRRGSSLPLMPLPGSIDGIGAAKGGSVDDGIGSGGGGGGGGGSLYAGGGPPVTPPTLPSSASGRFVTQGDEFGGSLLAEGEGTSVYAFRRPSSSGGGGGEHFHLEHPSVGAGGGCVGALDSGDNLKSEGSFRSVLEPMTGGAEFDVGDSSQLWKLFGATLDPSSAEPMRDVEMEYTDASDTSTNVSDNSEDENARVIADGGGSAARGCRLPRTKQEFNHAGMEVPHVVDRRFSLVRTLSEQTVGPPRGFLQGKGRGTGADVLGSGFGDSADSNEHTRRGEDVHSWQHHARREQQTHLDHMQPPLPLPSLEAPCSPHHQAHGHHRHRRRDAAMKSDGDQTAHSPQQQQQQQQLRHNVHQECPLPTAVPRIESEDSAWHSLLTGRVSLDNDNGSIGGGGGGGSGAVGGPSSTRIPAQPNIVYDGEDGGGKAGDGSGGGEISNPSQANRSTAIAAEQESGDSPAYDDAMLSLNGAREPPSEMAAAALVGGIASAARPMGPDAVLAAPGNHARNLSYGLGDWLPPTDVALDDLDFLDISEETQLPDSGMSAAHDHDF